MIYSLFGLAAGIGTPMQTSVNAQLGKRLGSPFLAALVNFTVALLAMVVVTLIAQHTLAIPLGTLAKAPPWVCLGGAFAVFFVTGNILLMPRIGSVQTAILPAFGQILMGTLVDTFGWFESSQRDMTALRSLGVALVFSGVLLIVLSKSGMLQKRVATRPNANAASGQNVSAGQNGSVSANHSAASWRIWIWRIVGIACGMCMASQTAVNSHLSIVVDSRLFAAVINLTVGLILLIVLNALLWRTKKPVSKGTLFPAWFFCGGLFGALFVVGNIITARMLGTGMAVVILLTGLMIGGLLVDQFGMFRAPQRSVSIREIAGVAVMVVGAALFHLA